MKIINVNEAYRSCFAGSVATIGFFDGVHSGHRFLIQQLKQIAADRGLLASVVTFPFHPQLVLNPQLNLSLLTSWDEKMQLLSDAGTEVCFVTPFTIEFSCMDAESFIKNFLHEKLNVQHLLIGYDHRFGRNREAGFDEYLQYGTECGMAVSRAKELEGEHVSSTIIRRLLQAGCVEEANEMLSYNYVLEGEVIDGNKLGRTIGFPTANLRILDGDKLIPGTGIYFTKVHLGDETFSGMAYIGSRPTVSDRGEQRVEVHILGFDREIYGEVLRVEFVRFIRDDRTFGSLEELKVQLEDDRKRVLNETC
ncbi:MAG: riboflavin biosynthesis protein RibF [Dysgonamonadaceae bacterium]|jgi:riboflavin kinase/FMN adenylyltransferase|nr:riboflavin biosynthesis protein RibF [Dysgonamonadaceae bacterium]